MGNHPAPTSDGHPQTWSQANRGFVAHAQVYVLVNALLIGIWAASGFGSFWPIWPILGWGLGVGLHAAGTYSSSYADTDD